MSLAAGLLIITDDIYEKLYYGEDELATAAALSREAKEHTVVLNGVSKAYSMTGWRIGYAAGPEVLISAMGRIQSQSTSNPTSISQCAATEALNGAQDEVERMRVEFKKRREVMVEGLNSIEGVSCLMPLGAFYVFANVSGLYGKSHNGTTLKDSISVASFLLEEAEVAVVPGIAFGDDSHVRLSYSSSEKDIKVGIERIKEAVGRLG